LLKSNDYVKVFPGQHTSIGLTPVAFRDVRVGPDEHPEIAP
jgi:hypothetical protein